MEKMHYWDYLSQCQMRRIKCIRSLRDEQRLLVRLDYN